MSCALPCTWWCCTIEPVWAPPRKLRTKSLSYVCSGLFCKPILCFILYCGIRVASKSYVDSISSSKWLLNLWKCDDLLRNSFVHLRSNVYCEDYMLQFLSVDSTYLFVYQDANGCHPLQDGSANVLESRTQWRESGEPSATTSASGGMASYHGSHQRQCSDDSATLART